MSCPHEEPSRQTSDNMDENKEASDKEASDNMDEPGQKELSSPVITDVSTKVVVPDIRHLLYAWLSSIGTTHLCPPITTPTSRCNVCLDSIVKFYLHVSRSDNRHLYLHGDRDVTNLRLSGDVIVVTTGVVKDIHVKSGNLFIACPTVANVSSSHSILIWCDNGTHAKGIKAEHFYSVRPKGCPVSLVNCTAKTFFGGGKIDCTDCKYDSMHACQSYTEISNSLT